MSNVLASLIVKIGADIKDYSDGLKQATSQLSQIGREMTDAGATLTAGITGPIVGLGAAAIETAGKFEQTSIAFTHFLGSVQASRAFLGDLYNFAATTPFQIGDVTKGAQALMAMGFAAKDIVPDLRILGDQLSAVGRTENMQQIILAFGEMKAKGVASMKEIRQMVTDGVIPAVRYLAEGLGKSETEIFDMIKKKAIDSGTAIKLIMAGMQKDTGGMMQEQMGSFNGQMSNLKDQITLALKDIGDALLPLAKDMVALAASAINSIKGIAHAFGELPVPVQEGIIVIAGIAAAIGPALLSFGLLASALRSVMVVWPVMAAGGKAVAAMLTGSLEPALLALGSTLTVAFAGLMAFAIGRWAYDNIPGVKALGDSLADMIAKIPGVQKLIDYLSVGSEHANLQAQVDKAVLTLKEHNVVIQQGSMSLTEYATKLRLAMAGLTDNTAATDRAAKAAHDLALLNGANAEALKEAEKALAKVKEAYRLHAASAEDVAAAEDRVRKALAAVHPEYDSGTVTVGRHAAALIAAEKALAEVEKANRMGLATNREVRLAQEAVTEAYKAANPQVTQWWTKTDQATFAMQQLHRIMLTISPPLKRYFDSVANLTLRTGEWSEENTKVNLSLYGTLSALTPLATVMDAVTKQVDKWSDAFKTLGITSSATLKKQAADALAAFNTIRASGASTAHDIQVAWVAMEKARQAAAEAAGNAITKADKLALASAEQALGQHVRTMRGDWLSAVTSIKQSIEGNLSRAFGDILFQVGSIGDAFRRLGQDVVQIILDYIIKAGIEALIAKLFVQKAVTSAMDVGEVMSYAAVAAAAAFASTAAIPIVGPIMAPAAAAAAYAGTAAYAPLASFDKGGFIPEDMIAQVHKGEFVLTADQVAGRKPLPPAARGNDGGSVSVTIHVHADRSPEQTAKNLMRHLKALSPKFSPAS